VADRELARLAIGFVDLVGSTTMQAALDPAALGEQVSQFEARAFDVTTAGGGRLVKFIGDEIMVAAIDPVAGVRIVGDLVAAFTEDGTQPRGGLVFGEVLFRHGDYYGPVVNLAARLVMPPSRARCWSTPRSCGRSRAGICASSRRGAAC
jgi:adenylate cyclase